jgi:hypothetical protein
MAVTLAAFKLTFPEFNLDGDADATIPAIQDALITAKLAEAEGQIDRGVFQTETNADSAVKYLAAHLLACSPSGINARLVKDKKGDPRTLYHPTYVKLITAATVMLGRVA